MARIAVFNQKGGVGKTTTTLNLAAAVAARGGLPLAIDLDPQAHLSAVTRTVPPAAGAGIYEATPGDSEASVTDWRAGANYYFGRHVGLCAQYKHYTYSYDRGILASKLGGEINFEGFQLFASFLF